jgi:hypothetical protein
MKTSWDTCGAQASRHGKNDKGELGCGSSPGSIGLKTKIDREVVGADGLEPPTYAV